MSEHAEAVAALLAVAPPLSPAQLALLRAMPPVHPAASGARQAAA